MKYSGYKYVCDLVFGVNRNAHTNHEITSRHEITRGAEKDHTAGGNEKPYLATKTRILKSRLISQKKEEVHDPYFSTIPMLYPIV